ncbi:unnamed protein product [Paramecium octaurelia]|uniref:Cytochrome b5 heme-binding domain-containing protein n=1 Tax=Paramecium octaurelia TaxID=43137 RepID=A0A8S1WV11_PAROT|nr:unnamed protein product [Paramecium octaurelia]
MLNIVVVLSFACLARTQELQDSQTNRTFLDYNSVEQSQEMQLTEVNEDRHTVFYFHKWSNFIVWGILADVGLLANRYGIFLKHRLNLHSIIMGLCVLPTMIADILMSLIWNPPQFHGKEHLAYWHAPIGFAFLGLMGLQSIGGLILKLCIENKRTQKTIKIQQIFHIYLGYFMYVVGKIQCGIGFYEVYNYFVEDGRWNLIGFWITYALIFFWRVLLEFVYQNGTLFSKIFKQKEEQCQPKTIQDALFVQHVIQNDLQSIQRDYNDQMWFIFNNEIINLTGFVHPGGQYIWEKTKGREISRFIYGSQGLEDGSCPAFKHSDKAIQMIKQNTIGRINNINFIIQNNSVLQYNTNLWKLITINQISEKVGYFGFDNEYRKVSSQLTNYNQFGRYYQVKAHSNSQVPIRQYTCIISMAPENVQYRKQLINLVETQLHNKECFDHFHVQPKYLNELPLIIKNYESKNGLSQYIHKNQYEQFQITGPYGPSLGLPNKGKIVIICGGTGILPFLDLLDFLLQSTIYEIVEKKYGKQFANILNPLECSFHTNLHITLIFAAANKSELIGSNIYFPLISLQKQLPQQCFKMILKVKEWTENVCCVNERFNKVFFQKHIGFVSQYEKFYICGPPSMSKSIPPILKELGVQEQDLHFV